MLGSEGTVRGVGGLGLGLAQAPHFYLYDGLNALQGGTLSPIEMPGSSPDLAGYRGEVSNG
jgi:hypothetical protein